MVITVSPTIAFIFDENTYPISSPRVLAAEVPPAVLSISYFYGAKKLLPTLASVNTAYVHILAIKCHFSKLSFRI
jgi:hypothetical protein